MKINIVKYEEGFSLLSKYCYCYYYCFCSVSVFIIDSGGSRGGAWGAWAPHLIFRPNWGLKGQKIFVFDTAPPFSKGLDDPSPPFSNDLDLALIE